MSLSSKLLGVILLGALCGASFSEDGASLERFEARLEDDSSQLAAQVKRLETLSAGYAVTDPSAAADLRRQLRSDISARSGRLSEDLRRFDEAAKERDYKASASIVAQILNGGKVPNVQLNLMNMLDQSPRRRAMQDALTSALKTLTDEQAAYEAASAASARIRRRRLAAAGAGLVLLIGLSAALLRRRGRTPLLSMGSGGGSVTAGQADGARGESLSSAAMPPLEAAKGAGSSTGAIAGAYRLVRKLPRGSMGQAWEAVEIDTGKKVLVKRLRDELHEAEMGLGRLQTQARLVAALRHPNLVELLSVFVDDGRLHIAMEHVQGLPLSRFLDPGNRISPDSVRRVMRQCSLALECAHAKGILHGDLKPSNILVTQGGTVKVSDLGIASEARRMLAKKAWAEPVGSPAYMAPEAEVGDMGKGSDVYALGVVLYEMLTGRLPFEGPNFLVQKREMRYRAPSGLAGGSADMDAVIHRALQAEPRHRFQSAAEFIQALDGSPGSASSPESPA